MCPLSRVRCHPNFLDYFLTSKNMLSIKTPYCLIDVVLVTLGLVAKFHFQSLANLIEKEDKSRKFINFHYILSQNLRK